MYKKVMIVDDNSKQYNGEKDYVWNAYHFRGQ